MTLDYDNPKDAEPQNGGGWQVVLLWCAGGLLLLVVGFLVLMPSMGRARETANRIKCGNCLRQIGLAADIYARNHGGALPADLVALYRYADITSELYICPSSDLDRAKGQNPDEIAAALLAGNHLSYAWTGGGLTTSAPTDTIIAFDLEMHVPKHLARTTGMNVLFADRSVAFVTEADAQAIRAQFHAGVRPIRLPTTAPTASTKRRSAT